MNWLISLGLLGFLVMVHEWGHMIVARYSGVRILKFSVGFGPRLFSWTRGHTEYALSLIPLGGYVKMAGEQQAERAQQPWEFLSKSIGTRAKVIFAGPCVNYLVGFLALWVVFVMGYPELLPVVGQTSEDMPARAVGLQEGDRIRAIDGVAVGTWDEMSENISKAADRPLILLVDREGTSRRVAVTPTAKEITDPLGHRRTVGLIGIQPKGEFTSVRFGPIAAVGRTIAQQWEWVMQTFQALGSMLTGRLSMRDSMAGPIGIVMLTSEAIKVGIVPMLFVGSLLSTSLAIFNLFPLPILDGGHLLFLALEKLRGRPVSINIQERAAQVSFLVLMTFILMVCINDVNRFGLLDKVVGWMKH